MRSARPKVMGVINATPDSFSDGGCHRSIEAAVARAEAMIAEGADVIDVGGESTRPGAEPVSEAEERARVVPLIEAMRRRFDTPISIDSYKPGVARAAIAAGADIWNDVTALTADPSSLATAVQLRRGVVLMHMKGEPATMQTAPAYDEVVGEVANWLAGRAQAAMAAGVDRGAIWLDPGIGFGKRLEHNLALLGGLDRLVALGFPVLLGGSRKGMIRGIDPSAVDPLDRLGGSLAIAIAGARAGCAMIRVHDVRETVQALEVAARIESARAPSLAELAP